MLRGQRYAECRQAPLLLFMLCFLFSPPLSYSVRVSAPIHLPHDSLCVALIIKWLQDAYPSLSCNVLRFFFFFFFYVFKKMIDKYMLLIKFLHVWPQSYSALINNHCLEVTIFIHRRHLFIKQIIYKVYFLWTRGTMNFPNKMLNVDINNKWEGSS